MLELARLSDKERAEVFSMDSCFLAHCKRNVDKVLNSAININNKLTKQYNCDILS